ncbi:hypothetical protein GC209_07795 [bacterium]|nr:hypothetical protein [bacterium]
MSQSLPARLFYAIPVVGPVTRAVEKDIDLIWYVLVIMLTALVLAVKIWGLVALTLTALAMVPVMLGLIVAISRP